RLPYSAWFIFLAPATGGTRTLSLHDALPISGTGDEIRLENGGRKLSVNGQVIIEHGDVEYAGIYDRFADLLNARQSDVDAAPLRLMADVFLMGARENGPDFEW